MEKIKPTQSDCCKAQIEFDHKTRYSTYDICAACKKHISYALVGRFHDESMAVCELYDNEMYYFWQQVHSWTDVVNHHQEYVGQLKTIVGSPSAYYNQDGDRISYSGHKSFSNYYKDLVKNPQWAL